ncbi:MAG: hypothetical protein HDQ97_05440 [Lachnospiraceae bacterium]|nr:hypothetical protein [Lachnospiraceae bacterium]
MKAPYEDAFIGFFLFEEVMHVERIRVGHVFNQFCSHLMTIGLAVGQALFSLQR